MFSIHFYSNHILAISFKKKKLCLPYSPPSPTFLEQFICNPSNQRLMAKSKGTDNGGSHQPFCQIAHSQQVVLINRDVYIISTSQFLALNIYVQTINCYNTLFINPSLCIFIYTLYLSLDVTNKPI